MRGHECDHYKGDELILQKEEWLLLIVRLSDHCEAFFCGYSGE